MRKISLIPHIACAICLLSPAFTGAFNVQIAAASTVDPGIVSLSPGSTATGVCCDTPLYVTFSEVPVLRNAGQIRICTTGDLANPVDVIDLSSNSTEHVQARSVGGETLNTYPVIISGNTAAIYPHAGVFTSNETYCVLIDTGVFADASGNQFTGITNPTVWQFTTKPTGPADPCNLIVAADGSGDFCTVQGAVDFLPPGNSTPVIISIRNGDYNEVVRVVGKNKIIFRGESREQTVVGYANNNNLNGTLPTRTSFFLNGDDCAIETVTLTNRTPDGGSQAEAINVRGTRNILYNMTLASYQDTFLTSLARTDTYLEDCLVLGDIDFLWGNGTVYMTNSEIRALTDGSILTQSRTPTGENGFALVDCRVTKAFPGGTISMGRTIHNPDSSAVVLFMRCLMDDAVTGYSSDAGVNMGDYACSNLTATAPMTLANSTHYTESDPYVAAAQSASTWFGGWSPALPPSILTQPADQSVTEGASVDFSVTVTGIPTPTCQWQHNGTNLVGETAATLRISNVQAADAGEYAVVVSNASGTVTSTAAILKL